MVSLSNNFTFFCFQFWRNKAAAIFLIILFSFPVMYQTIVNFYMNIIQDLLILNSGHCWD